MEQAMKIDIKQPAFEPVYKRDIKKEKSPGTKPGGDSPYESVEISVSDGASSDSNKTEKITHNTEVRIQEPEKISRKFFVDKITGRIGVRIIEEGSHKVKQIPPEYQMAISRYIKVMTMMNS